MLISCFICFQWKSISCNGSRMRNANFSWIFLSSCPLFIFLGQIRLPWFYTHDEFWGWSLSLCSLLYSTFISGYVNPIVGLVTHVLLWKFYVSYCKFFFMMMVTFCIAMCSPMAWIGFSSFVAPESLLFDFQIKLWKHKICSCFASRPHKLVVLACRDRLFFSS